MNEQNGNAEKKVVIAEAGGDPAPASRMGAAMGEICAGVKDLIGLGIGPEAALTSAKEVWDKVTNHDVLAVGMASFTADVGEQGGRGLPAVHYQLGAKAKGGEQREHTVEVRNDPYGLIAQAMSGEYIKMGAAGRVPTAAEKAMVIAALRDGGITPQELDGLAYELRQIEDYVKATQDEIFGRASHSAGTHWHPGTDLVKLLAEGWSIDPDMPVTDGCCGIPPYGWAFHFATTATMRLVHPDRPEYKYIESDPAAVVHFKGRLLTDADPTKSYTYGKFGREDWERRVFHGLKAFAGDQEFFHALVGDRGMGRFRQDDARYEFARILVELRLMTPDRGMTMDLAADLAADPFGATVMDIFNGPRVRLT